MKKFTLSLLTIAAFLSSCDPTETDWEEQTLPSFLASDSPWESMGIFDVGDVNMNCPEMDYLFVEDGSIEVWFANCVPPNYPTFARWDLAKRRATEMVYPDTNTLKLGWQMPLYSRYIDDKFYVVQSDQNTVEYYTKDGTTLSTVLIGTCTAAPVTTPGLPPTRASASTHHGNTRGLRWPSCGFTTTPPGNGTPT